MSKGRIRQRLGRPRGRDEPRQEITTTGRGDLYLELLKSALTNELYLENDLRLEHLYERVTKSLPIVDDVLDDPARAKIEDLRRLAARRHAGHPTGGQGEVPTWAPYAMGHLSLDVLEHALDEIHSAGVGGHFVDVGVGLAGTSMFMRGHLAAHDIDDREVWLVDRFRAAAPGEQSSDLLRIRDGFRRFGLFDDRVRFLQGEPIDAIASAGLDEVALVRIGALPSHEVEAVLAALASRLSVGAQILVDTFDDEVAAAAASFASRHGLEIVEPIGTVGSRMQTTSAIDAAIPESGRARVELPQRSSGDPLDLSMVVVLYNMSREAQRTLYSMSRQYQFGLDDVEYEVLVVDNGSSEPHRLTPEAVRAFGPEFRLIEMADDATSSPIPALVRGTREARGNVVAFMIDGAHVLTPGVLSHGLRGMHAYAPAVVATQQWYLGPGQQNDAMLAGYDEDFEDQLFAQIDWPSDGYRLFDIGTFIGDRDWLDGMWESNCLFAPRALVEQVGGFDDRFDEAGGGYANLDLYERLAGSPDVTLVTILGEGSFHQTHGGTTTNQAEILERGRKLIQYRDHFTELKGRPYRGPASHMHYVGNIWGPSRRSKARRLSSPQFAQAAEALERPIPMPDELKSDLIATVFNTLGWQDTRWFGHQVRRAPTDLIAYQELIERVRPEVIIATNAGDDGGLPAFLATMCDFVGSGRVLAVGPPGDDAPTDDHDRVTRIDGHAYHAGTAGRVLKAAADEPAMVFIGRDTVHRVAKTFKAYQHLVRAGSYVVVEDTIVNGNPVLVDHGPGPMEAVLALLMNFGDFVSDRALERFGLTFNPAGYLLRRTDDEASR